MSVSKKSDEPVMDKISSGEESIISIIVSSLKKASVVGIVYFAGYMQWSVAWFIGPIVLFVLRDQWKKSSDKRRAIAKATALCSEKDVVLARLNDLPAWVFFPDIERAEWLNRILKQVWPNVNHYVRSMVRDSIQPVLKQSLEKYKLHGFKFERIILGTVPFRIGGVKVYDRNVDRNEIIMDLDIFYAGDCDITFHLSGMKGGIRDFQLHGMLRVVMKPLITTIPLVGGLQVFFLNNPDIDFDLVGIADVLDMPGLSDILRRIVVETVASMMVLPNKFPIKLSDEVESVDLKAPEPEGVLRVHVIEARHLMKKDISVLGKGKSDPYAVVTVGAQEFKTKVIDNNVDPKWDFWCEVTVSSSEAQYLTVCCWDWDPKIPGQVNDDFLGRLGPFVYTLFCLFEKPFVQYLKLCHDFVLTLCLLYVTQFVVERISGTQLMLHLFDKDKGPRDDDLGRATIEVSNIVKKGSDDMWVTLEQAKHGMVHLRLTWLSLSKDYKDLDTVLFETQMLRASNLNTAILTIFLDSAKSLPQARMSTKPDPYAVLKVGNKTQQTNVLMRTIHPVWEQGFTFLVANPENDSLYLSIMDQKTNTEIGQITYKIKNLSNKTDLELSKEPFSLLKSGPESKVVWSMHLRILKKSGDETMVGDDPKILERTDSNTSTPPIAGVEAQSQLVIEKEIPATDNEVQQNTGEVQEIVDSSISAVSSVPLSQNSDGLLHRTPSITSSAGEAGLGRIQMTLRYSVQRQKLIVVVHKVMNIPIKDPSNIPDPYVKLYLLPERAKDTKRKTQVIKDNYNPVFDESFEYVLNPAEFLTKQLEVTVGTQKQLFYSSSNILGQVIVDLGKLNLTQPYNVWFDLQPEIDHD